MSRYDDPARGVAADRAQGLDELPACVVATRPSSAGPWRTGAMRERSHAQWRVRTVDATKKKGGHTVAIPFDAPIAPGTTLADPALAADASTKRVLVLRAATAGFGDGQIGALAIAALAQKFDWLVRWRVDHGAGSFTALGLMDYDAFLARLRTGGVLGLVDIEGRLDAWTAEIRDCATAVPLASRDADAPADRGRLAAQLGVTPKALECAGFDGLLQARLALLVPGRARGTPDGVPTPPPGKPPTAAFMEGYIAAWRCLAVASCAGLLAHDPLRFDPAQRGSAQRLAERLGSAGGRTPTIEPDRLFALLLATTRRVHKDGPTLVAAMAGHAATGTRDPEVDGLPLATAVRHFMAACAILMGGLAGRRIGESESARAGCVREAGHGHSLAIYIEKCLQDVDEVVVPALVAVALKTLEALSARCRTVTGEPWLFRVVLPSGRVVNFDPSADLASFATACGWNAGPDGAVLASHQLRRGFALALYHGYAIGSLDAVSRQLRHSGPGPSATYVTEAAPGGTLHLRDRLAARLSVSLRNLPEADKMRLRFERARLSGVREAGGTFDAGRCEAAALALLEAWPDEASGADPGLAIDLRSGQFPAMKARAATVVRIGSQARRFGTVPEPPLLDVVRAHAAALFGPGTT